MDMAFSLKMWNYSELVSGDGHYHTNKMKKKTKLYAATVCFYNFYNFQISQQHKSQQSIKCINHTEIVPIQCIMI